MNIHILSVDIIIDSWTDTSNTVSWGNTPNMAIEIHMNIYDPYS